MEKVEVDEDDRPKETISITGATVYVNPYRDEEAAEKKAAEEARLKVCEKRNLSNSLALACLLDCLGLWQLSKPLSQLHCEAVPDPEQFYGHATTTRLATPACSVHSVALPGDDVEQNR